jgi:hypothetical protein
LTWLRTGDAPGLVSIEHRAARFSESTIAARLRAVISCYDYHVLNGLVRLRLGPSRLVAGLVDDVAVG